MTHNTVPNRYSLFLLLSHVCIMPRLIEYGIKDLKQCSQTQPREAAKKRSEATKQSMHKAENKHRQGPVAR